jgi:hypothetical protein
MHLLKELGYTPARSALVGSHLRADPDICSVASEMRPTCIKLASSRASTIFSDFHALGGEALAPPTADSPATSSKVTGSARRSDPTTLPDRLFRLNTPCRLRKEKALFLRMKLSGARREVSKGKLRYLG